MFRLIQLETENGLPRIGVAADGYVSARTALAHYRSRPAAYFGVGRFDHEGTLAEIILDRLCGPLGDCPRPATLVHAATYHRLCETCAAGLDADRTARGPRGAVARGQPDRPGVRHPRRRPGLAPGALCRAGTNPRRG